MNKHKKKHFLGKLGFVLSAAGASVGLEISGDFHILLQKYGGGIFFTYLYHTGINLRLHFDHGGDFSWTYDKEKSCWSILETLENPFYIPLADGSMRSFQSLLFPYYSVIGGWVLKNT